ncbi:MAG: hypothetical protein PHT19_02860 [Methylococcus sp.]|nr:hypothetical protein [Methylococcus sp.]
MPQRADPCALVPDRPCLPPDLIRGQKLAMTVLFLFRFNVRGGCLCSPLPNRRLQ